MYNTYVSKWFFVAQILHFLELIISTKVSLIVQVELISSNPPGQLDSEELVGANDMVVAGDMVGSNVLVSGDMEESNVFVSGGIVGDSEAKR